LESGTKRVYDLIAPVFGLFYNHQRRGFCRALAELESCVSWRSFASALDVGCGTGALCSVLQEHGLQVTGIDASRAMLKVGAQMRKNVGIEFRQESVLEGLSFDHESVDMTFACHVAHGMTKGQRGVLYQEMKRITKHWVILYDYNQRRKTLTDFVEWLEGGDYFRFIQEVHGELREHFSAVTTVPVTKQSSWYVCQK